MSQITLAKSGRVLPDLSQQMAELRAEMAKLAAENATLKAKASNPRAISCKVSQSGCLSVFGGRLRRMGVTLYITEWETLFDNLDAIKAFATTNADQFSRK